MKDIRQTIFRSCGNLEISTEWKMVCLMSFIQSRKSRIYVLFVWLIEVKELGNCWSRMWITFRWDWDLSLVVNVYSLVFGMNEKNALPLLVALPLLSLYEKLSYHDFHGAPSGGSPVHCHALVYHVCHCPNNF